MDKGRVLVWLVGGLVAAWALFGGGVPVRLEPIRLRLESEPGELTVSIVGQASAPTRRAWSDVHGVVLSATR